MCVPQLIFGGRQNGEIRIAATIEEKVALGFRAEEKLHYFHNKGTGQARWEVAGGSHIRLVSAGDLGSTQFAAFCYVTGQGGAWLMWPDLVHIIARRECQARSSCVVLRKTLAKTMIACRALKGPFGSNKNRKAMMESHGRMMEAFPKQHPRACQANRCNANIKCPSHTGGNDNTLHSYYNSNATQQKHQHLDLKVIAACVLELFPHV